jgi:uncharacterized protein (TIGR03118 family)
MKNLFNRKSNAVLLSLLILFGTFVSSPAQKRVIKKIELPPTNQFVRRNLISNRYDANDPTSPPFANIIDPNIVDAWGAAIRTAGLGGHFWLANAGTSTVTTYVGDVRNANGTFTPLFQDALKVIPVDGTPIGQVFSNSASDFPVSGSICSDDGEVGCSPSSPSYVGEFSGPSRFIVCTEEGKIAAWTENRTAQPFGRMRKFVNVVDNSASGALYRGLAISERADGNWLYLANFTGNAIEIYGPNWLRIRYVWDGAKYITPFAKPRGLPASYRPFNIQIVGGNVYVAYAQLITPASPDYDPNDPFAERHCAGCGYVAVYDQLGRFIQMLESGGKLNSPWGFALAPSNFGSLSNALLVGNFGDGTIVAFDRQTGAQLDYLRDAQGNAISIDGLWAIFFGNGASLGRSDYLYWSAGYNGEADGGFGSLNWIGAVNPNP